MKKELSWTKEVFNRKITIMEAGQPVGSMQRDTFSPDVDASLHGTHLRFDVTGFLIHDVAIYDLNANNQKIGAITLHFGKRAELRLETGDIYIWKRHNMLMREWDMIREDNTGTDSQEVINYSLTRQFFAESGDIELDNDTPNASIVILAGLFLRNYFQRRRRMAAGALIATGA